MSIHPTAVVDPRAEIHPDAELGPYAVVDGPAKIGAGTRLLPHAVVMGWTEIGEGNVVHSGAVLGDAPQDLSYHGAKSYLRIGDRNVFREGVQVHRGTAPESTTIIGNDNFFMANSHVAHNCRVGNHIILTNNAVLGGYVEIGDRAFLSASCAVHQFVRVGQIAIMRGMSATSRDVPPFSHHRLAAHGARAERGGVAPGRFRRAQDPRPQERLPAPVPQAPQPRRRGKGPGSEPERPLRRHRRAARFHPLIAARRLRRPQVPSPRKTLRPSPRPSPRGRGPIFPSPHGRGWPKAG